jgi:hypothetical protein
LLCSGRFFLSAAPVIVLSSPSHKSDALRKYYEWHMVPATLAVPPTNQCFNHVANIRC